MVEPIDVEVINQYLAQAASRGEVDNLREAFRDWDADPNYSDVEGKTPLWFAIQSDQIEAAQVLLRAGADPNPGIINGLTLLDVTGLLEDSDSFYSFVRLLLEHGADPKQCTTNAVLYGLVDEDRFDRNLILECVELFLEKGGDPNGLDHNGDSALHILRVEFNGSWVVPLVRCLLRHKANPNLISTRHNRTPLQGAVIRSTPIPDERAARDSIEIVEAMLEAGADPTLTNDSGQSILYLLSQQRGLIANFPGDYALDQMTSLLLEYGADPHAVDQSGRNTASWIERKYEFKVRRDPELRDDLLLAIMMGRYEIAESLLDQGGVNVNQKSQRIGRTPIFFTAMRGAASLTQKLLDCGANPFVKDRHEASPLEVARNMDDLHIIVRAIVSYYKTV